jgi:hypothetical protein
MRYWTYAELKDKVRIDLGLEQEDFVKPEELLGYCNAAIDEAEAEIHTLYQDYFLTYSTIDLVQGQDLYSLPTNIYANKIRGIVYKRSDTEIYTVRRVQQRQKFIDVEIAETYYQEQDVYRYILVNNTAGTPQILLVPDARENITAALRIWYIRNANRLTLDTDVLDIPEFANFILQYMKVRCYEKEGHPNLNVAIGLLERQRILMTETLNEMVIDNDNEIEKDMSLYEEMV